MKTTVLLSPILALILAGHAVGESLPGRLESLTENYERAIERATAPIERKYVEELRRLKEELTKQGDLKGALEVDAVLKMLEGENSKLAELLVRQKWRYYNPSHKLEATVVFHEDGTARVSGQMSGNWSWRIVGEDRLEIEYGKESEVVFEFKNLRKLDVVGKHIGTDAPRSLSPVKK